MILSKLVKMGVWRGGCMLREDNTTYVTQTTNKYVHRRENILEKILLKEEEEVRIWPLQH